MKENVETKKIVRAYKTLSECNQAMVRLHGEDTIAQAICQVLVETGGYRFAWVGYTEQGNGKVVRPVADYGFAEGYLESLKITWENDKHGQGPTGTAIRTGEPSIARNIETDPSYEPWRSSALERGYLSSIALPLDNHDRVFGALNVYSGEPDAFDEGEVRLLEELADDLSYAITAIRTRQERDQALKAKIESEARYHHLFNTMQEGFALHEVICDEDGKPVDYRFLEVNPAFEELTGLKPEQVLGKTVREVLPGIQDCWIETYGQIALKQTTKRFERYAQPLGRYYLIDAFSPAEGQFATLFVDITKRKRLEKYLLKSEERFRTITESSVAGVYIIQDGGFKYVNPALAGIFGYSREEILEQKTIPELVHPDDRSLVMENLRRRLEGEVDAVLYEFKGICKDGTTIHCAVFGRLVDYMDKPAVLGTLIDITERKIAADKLAQQLGRMKALREIDVAISSNLELRMFLNIFLSRALQELKVDAADVLTYNRDLQLLTYQASRGFNNHERRRTQRGLGEGFAGQAALERRNIIIPDISETEGEFNQASPLAQEKFVFYVAAPLIVKGEVKGVMQLYHRSPLEPDQEWLDFLEILAGQASIAMDNIQLFEELDQSNTQLMHSYDATLEGWARALEYRDDETEGHSKRVTELAVRLALEMGVKSHDLVNLRRGALLHDIGKIGIPDSILQKPGPLDKEEWEIMKKHTIYAYEMLHQISFLRPALEIPYYHHEKWDGSGYPQGLQGEEIPLAARIFTIVDVWDALCSDRPYRQKLSKEKARETIEDQAGKHFDPEVVRAFLKMIKYDERQT